MSVILFHNKRLSVSTRLKRVFACFCVCRHHHNVLCFFYKQGNGHERDFMNDQRVFIMDMYNRYIYPGDSFAKSEWVDQHCFGPDDIIVAAGAPGQLKVEVLVFRSPRCLSSRPLYRAAWHWTLQPPCNTTTEASAPMNASLLWANLTAGRCWELNLFPPVSLPLKNILLLIFPCN